MFLFIGVNLRTKKKRVVGEDSQDGFEEPERPMSWEGELSDAEISIVAGVAGSLVGKKVAVSTGLL